MASQGLLHSLPITPVLNEFTDAMQGRKVPSEVLEALHVLASKYLPLAVLGAARFPVKTSDWRSTRLGKDAFLYPAVPPGLWGGDHGMAGSGVGAGAKLGRGRVVVGARGEDRAQ